MRVGIVGLEPTLLPRLFSERGIRTPIAFHGFPYHAGLAPMH